MESLIAAMHLAFTFETMMWLAIGVFLGVALGAIPGLTSSTGIALMLPLTFMLDVAGALGLLIGLYKGAVYGGSISAISFATPGAPDSAATVYDGYAMTKQGKGRKAVQISLYSSVTADTLSDVAVILIAPMMALAALQFGPSERFWLMILAIALLGTLSGKHLAKGMLSAAIGLFLGTIGTDPVGNLSRNTFEQSWLQDGIHLVPLIIGIFAMAQIGAGARGSEAIEGRPTGSNAVERGIFEEIRRPHVPGISEHLARNGNWSGSWDLRGDSARPGRDGRFVPLLWHR